MPPTSKNADLPQLYVLEWSPAQNVFHTGSLQQMVDENADAFVADDANDFIPIAVATTEAELERIKEKLLLKKETGA